MTVAPGIAGRIDAAFSAQNRQATPKALRNGPEFKQTAFVLMIDFEKDGMLSGITGKDCYISTRYKNSSEMLFVNDQTCDLSDLLPLASCAAAGPIFQDYVASRRELV